MTTVGLELSTLPPAPALVAEASMVAAAAGTRVLARRWGRMGLDDEACAADAALAAGRAARTPRTGTGAATCLVDARAWRRASRHRFAVMDAIVCSEHQTHRFRRQF